MGQEISEPIDESVEPYFLRRRDLKSIAGYIASNQCKKIAVMVGAGISTSAGIPDFRSPDTGLYANLKRLDLPEPEAVFDISYFRTNPLPFYTLAHDLYPGRYRPTITHSFIRLLHDKGLLLRCWTQNIDTLERAAGVPGDKLIEAHGSFASQRCIDCKEPYPDDLMRASLESSVSPPDIPTCIATPQCNGLVKPDIVFFGEPLPAAFAESTKELEDVDLAIVMGTSLTVYPFASLPMRVVRGPPRLLINKERVGELGSRPDDVILLRQCDDGVRELCAELGWLDELEALWAATETEEMRAKREEEARKRELPLSERLDEEVDKLTRDVEESLKVSKEHASWVETQLDKEKEKEGKRHSLEISGPDSPVLGYKAAEPVTTDEPKQEPKSGETKGDEPKRDETKQDEPKQDEPKPDEGKADA
ncbi:Sir2 histone deacetylase Hst2 [Orbilia brochopaga]|uniref:NAD-dependent protein deacetylase n=1 Tax=Orbilia brochopaga TaxID=3140254 RepID=A0AAV9UDK9_9PEZI